MRRALGLKRLHADTVLLLRSSLRFHYRPSLSQPPKPVVQSRNILTTIDQRPSPRPHPRLGNSVSMSSYPEVAEFFQYTSGRWLWDEEKQLRDRFTPFNVTELQNVAANSVGAKKCVAMTKLAEGSFNKIFRLKMDDGSTVIARVPHPIAGPAYYTTASEVATMDFVRIFTPSHRLSLLTVLIIMSGSQCAQDSCSTSPHLVRRFQQSSGMRVHYYGGGTGYKTRRRVGGSLSRTTDSNHEGSCLNRETDALSIF